MGWRCKVAFLLVSGLLLPHTLSPVETEAAWNPAGEVVEATYEVIPPQGKVHVTLNFTLTNLDEEARSQGADYRPWSTSIPSEATDARIYDPKQPIAIISTTPEELWTRYKYEFNIPLGYGMSYSYTMEFNIPVNANTASFTAWGYANKTTVKVLVPTGYYGEVTLSKEGYSTSTGGTRTAYTYDVPQDGRQFYTRVIALRTTGYQSISSTADLREKTPLITVEFYQGEEGKADHILALYQAALPLMEDLWDIPFPPGYPIVVREGTYQDTNGFAGTNGGRQGITIAASFIEDDDVLLHELAHYWANRPPLGERWLWEGYAELYTYLTLRALGDNLTAQDIIDGRTRALQSYKAECDFPLSQWPGDTPAGSCATGLGYGKSAVFLHDLYERFGLLIFKDTNVTVFSWEQDVDWFDYLHILETATGQELGRTFVGWVVPKTFGTAFQQWQSAERAYWATQGKVAQSRGALGIMTIENYLGAAKTLIKGGDFSEGSARVASSLELYEQWQPAYDAYQEAKAAVATSVDTLGIQSVKQSLSRTETYLTQGNYVGASSQAQMTVSLFDQWQPARRAFRDAEATVGQPADTLGFQAVRDGLDEAQSILTGGQFSQVGARVDSALSLFGEWQQALKAFRDAENSIGQPADTLGFQTVRNGLDKAQSLLTGGQFSQVAAQVDSALSLLNEWQQAVKTFRDAQAAIGEPADTLGFQMVRGELREAQSLLTGGHYSQVATQADATLSLFGEWQQALKAFRNAENSIGQPADTLGLQRVQDELDKASSLLTEEQFSQVGTQADNALSLFGQWERALEAYREAEFAISRPTDTAGLQAVLVELDKGENLLASGQFTETVSQINSTLTLFTQWQEAISALTEASASVAQAKAEGRTWKLSSAEATLAEASNLLLAGELERSFAQSQGAKGIAAAAATPLRAIAPYVGLALAVLGALMGGMILFQRRRPRPVAG